MMKNTRTIIITIALAISALCCSPPSAKPNQKHDVVSPNGNFFLNLPIEHQLTNPTYKGTRVWKVTISDLSGEVLYKDEESTMVGTLNVYWGWDSLSRVWLYNSDDGRIWRWEETPNGWVKIPSTREDGMPEWVLPEYARNR